MGVVSVDVSQQGRHVGRNPGAQVLGGQAIEMAAIRLSLNVGTLNVR